MDVYQRRRLVALAVVVAIIGLIVAIASAGGGGSDSMPVTSTTTPAVSKADFVNSADSICAETAASIANLPGTDSASDAQAELEYTQSELQQLRSLPRPEGDGAALDDFFTALKDQVRTLQKRADAANSGDSTTLASLDTQLASAKQNVRAAAADYGLTRCGKEGAPTGGGGGGGTAATTSVPTSTVPTTTTAAPATTTTATPTTPASDTGGTGAGTGGGTGGGGTGGGGSGGISGDSGGVTP
jgi:hypothetical protein